MVAQVHTHMPIGLVAPDQPQVYYNIPKGITALALSILMPLGLFLSTGEILTFTAYPLMVTGSILLSLIGAIYLIAGILELYLPAAEGGVEEGDKKREKPVPEPSTKATPSSLTNPNYFDDYPPASPKRELKFSSTPLLPTTPASSIASPGTNRSFHTPGTLTTSSTPFSSPPPSPYPSVSITKDVSYTSRQDQFDFDFDEWDPAANEEKE
jgi:hypothetical protein